MEKKQEKQNACVVCDIISKGTDLEIYSDNDIFVMMHPSPACQGHIIVVTKKHFPIIENIPDDLLAKVAIITNKILIVLFQGLKAQGTNLLVQNGIPAGQKHAHFIMNILPRSEGDGLNFDWEPKKLNEEEMSTVELKLKQEKKEIPVINEVPEKQEEVVIEDPENYLVKGVTRIP